MSLFSKQIDKRIAAYQRELIETHYREVDNMYRQIRGWRHDYRNHIQTMKVLAAIGDKNAIREYLDMLDTDLNTVDTVVKTGNPMADAILNRKSPWPSPGALQSTAMPIFPFSSKCPSWICAVSSVISLTMPSKQVSSCRRTSV